MTKTDIIEVRVVNDDKRMMKEIPKTSNIYHTLKTEFNFDIVKEYEKSGAILMINGNPILAEDFKILNATFAEFYEGNFMISKTHKCGEGWWCNPETLLKIRKDLNLE